MFPSFFLFLSSSEDMLIDFRVGEGERGVGRERERDTNQLPLTCAPTGNRTCDLPVYRMLLQPTEPHQPGHLAGF